MWYLAALALYGLPTGMSGMPNIVLILADDQSSMLADGLDHMPKLKGLVADGANPHHSSLCHHFHVAL